MLLKPASKGPVFLFLSKHFNQAAPLFLKKNLLLHKNYKHSIL